MDNFYEVIRQMTKDTPNDSELGGKIRDLFWQIDKENAKKLNAQKAASNQIDLEDMINEVNNGD
jgi:hypothetical protein